MGENSDYKYSINLTPYLFINILVCFCGLQSGGGEDESDLVLVRP